jgi:hypothetical protein
MAREGLSPSAPRCRRRVNDRRALDPAAIERKTGGRRRCERVALLQPMADVLAPWRRTAQAGKIFNRRAHRETVVDNETIAAGARARAASRRALSRVRG